MAKVDKSIELTDTVIDELLDDWFERDGETFLKIRKKGRIGWEKTLEEGEAYSAYLLEAPTQEDLIKRAYTLAKEMIVVMDPPFKVNVKITTGTSDSFTTGKTVCVSTAMFDDPELSVGEKLDTFLGVTIHEGCHLLYTDFKEMAKITKKVIHHIFNILEDERIEELCGENKPGLANFLEKSKYYYFDQYYLDYVVPKEKEGKLTPFDRIMNCFLHIIRYPKYLKEEEVVEFGHYLIEVKKVVVPYPITTVDTVKTAYKVYDIIKEFYEDVERELAESEGTGETESEILEKALKKLLEENDIPVISKDFLGARVGIVNKDGTNALLKIKEFLPLLAANMPYHEEYEQNISKTDDAKQTMVDVDIVVLAGDVGAYRAGITLAENLPNDDKLSLTIGGGRRNVYHRQIRFISDREKLQRRLDATLDKDQHKYYLDEADHWFTIGHENTHSLGPNKGTEALGKYKSIIEENKADMGALAFLDILEEKGMYSHEQVLQIIVLSV